MKRKSHILVIVGVLVLITAVLAVLHLTTRTQEQPGALQISYEGKTSYLSLDKLSLTEVSGTAVNGKGETKEISGPGISVYDVLSSAGLTPEDIKSVTVKADDEFHATLSVEDILEAGNAYLLQEEDDEHPRLVVFNDTDSKRRVKGVMMLEVE